MTIEELARLERLAKSATEGPWTLEVDQEHNTISVMCPGIAPTPQDEGRSPVYVANFPYWDEGERDAEFIIALREYTLPMLETIRTQSDNLLAVCRSGLQAAADRDRYAEKCETLQAIVDLYDRKDGPMFQAHLGEVKAQWELAEVKAERDRLREEITRIRNAIMEAGVSEPVQANLPFYLIDIGSWERIRAVTLSDVPKTSPTVKE